jgi:Mg-chelatase subunit ChlD
MKTIYGHQFRSGITAYLGKLGTALKLRLTVEWAEVQTPCIDLHRGAVMLPSVADDARLPASLIERYAGYCLHEILHALWTDRIPLQDRYLHQLANALEDARIERRAIREGLVGNAEGLFKGLLRGILAEVPSDIDWTDPRQYPFSLAVHSRQYGLTVPTPPALLPIWDEATRLLSDARCYAEVIDIAHWVLAQINRAADEAQKEDQSEGDSQGDQSEGGSDDGEDSRDDEGSEGDPQDGSEDQSEGNPQGPKVNRPKGEATETDAQVLIPGGGTAGSWGGELADHLLSRHTVWSPAPPAPAALAYSVRRLLDNSGHEAWDRNLTRGQVDAGRLHAAHTGSIFQRRREEDGIDSAVVIAVDCSSSMSAGAANGGDLRVAIEACEQLLTVLGRAQARAGVVLFDDYAQIAVPLGTPTPKALPIIRKARTSGGTATDEAVRVAAEMLYADRSERKIMLVLTDGETGYPQRLIQRVASAERCGITVIGIGIGSNSVTDTFTRHVVIRSVTDLARVAFDQIREAA